MAALLPTESLPRLVPTSSRFALAAERAGGASEVTMAALIYLALSLDKLRDYNSRMTRWHVNREVMVNTFDRHDFSFKWSYAEMAPLITGLGYDWAIEQTRKCIGELIALVGRDDHSTQRNLLSRARNGA